MKVEIGNATLYCGDSREILSALGVIDALVCDPPMAWPSGQTTMQRSMPPSPMTPTRNCFFGHAASSPAIARIFFARWDNLRSVPKPKSLITWVKNNWSMGDLDHEHGRQTEVAFFYPGPAHDFPNGRPPDVVRAPRTGNETHPTEKPVSLMTQVARWSRGTVVDPFMGTGSTGIACAALGRPFVGIEMDRGYFDIACERIAAAQSQTRLFIPPIPSAMFPQPTRRHCSIKQGLSKISRKLKIVGQPEPTYDRRTSKNLK